MGQIRGRIENGSINVLGLADQLQMYEGLDVLIQIDKLPLKRSLAQNRYYRKVVVGAFHKLWKEVVVYKCPKTGDDVRGLTREMVHEMLRANFLPIEIKSPKSGKTIKASRSTTDLSTAEMMDFIDSCRNYYKQETGEYIDPPEFF